MENTNFKGNLKVGQELENQVVDVLKKILPYSYEVFVTDQSIGSKEREEYNLCDVVVKYDDNVVLGIECKTGKIPYEKADRCLPWGSKYNTPINDSSLGKYKCSEFPMYILNHQEFAGIYLASPVNDLINNYAHLFNIADIDESGYNQSYGEYKTVGEKKVYVWNFDSRDWICKSNLVDILNEILCCELGIC